MTENWLQSYLVESVRRNLCTQIGCTTCVAHEFRLSVLRAWGVATGRTHGQGFDRESIDGITRALAEVHPIPNESRKFEDAVRCLLFDLCSGIPIFDQEIETILSGTWSGEVLRGMQEHHATRQAERRAFTEYNDPANVQKRREEKRNLKQEKHQERLALKKDRDRIWREQHENADKARTAEITSRPTPLTFATEIGDGGDGEIKIISRDYWVKVVEFLQQNWALIDHDASGGFIVWFIGDTSGVFDKLTFPSEEEAGRALLRNGFRRFTDDKQFAEFLKPPDPPFVSRDHPNGPIYSSGRFSL